MSRRSVLLFSLAAVGLVAAAAAAAWFFDLLPDSFGLDEGVGPCLVWRDADGNIDLNYSNILPGDYVGPDACAKCHEDKHKDWSKHPHRFMNQWASAQSVQGDFSGHVWEPRKGQSVTFSLEGGDYLMTIRRPGQKRTRYKVTRTVGSRYAQFYIGVQLEGDEPTDDERYIHEHKLPFAWWPRMKRWLPLDYFDAYEGDGADTLQDGKPVVDGLDNKFGVLRYDRNCVHCHNTYPHVYRAFKPNLSGYPDAVITPELRQMSAALAPWVEVPPDRDEFHDLPYQVDPTKGLVTLGISCESCHHGGREHATNPNRSPSFYPTHRHVRVRARTEEKPFTGKRDDPATSQGICAQCHSAKDIARQPNGARVRNSAESRDLADGFCFSQITCVSCHEPHTPGTHTGGPVPQEHIDACVNCHPKYDTPEAAAAHSRHPVGSAVNCLDCHMPRITQGVEEMMHTHQIMHPVQRSMVSSGAPNACNLCHLEKSADWTLAELKKGWGREIQPRPGTPRRLLDRPAGQVWLESKEMIVRMVAVDSYSRLPNCKKHLPTILGGMNDHTAVARALALIAAERALGRRVTPRDVDIAAGPDERRRQIEALLKKLRAK